jgi:hypothetical protein
MSYPYIILDEVYDAEKNNITILEQSEPSSNSRKVVFKAILQTLEEKNQNGRYYSMEIGREIVSALKPKAKSRSLFQEVDHPTEILNSQDDPMSVKRRMVTVVMKNAGALIRDIYIDKNNIIGEIETLSGFRGPDIYNLVVNDKANIGFSLRMFGREVRDANGTIKVDKPIKPITFDIVTNPSHSNARVMEFLPEDASVLAAELDASNIIIENDASNNNICVCESNFVREYVNTLVLEAFENKKLCIFKF